MKNDPSASSSELTDARRISLRLRRSQAPASPDTDSQPGYVRFNASKLAPVADQREQPVRPEVEASPVVPAAFEVPVHVRAASQSRTSESLTAILEWCRETRGSESVFVMNDQGLIVAATGSLDADEVERIGSRLMIGLEQAARMGELRGGMESIAVEFASGWLTGLRVALGGEQALTVGIVAEHPQPRELKAAMVDLLRQRFL